MTKKHVHGSLVFTASVPTWLPPTIVDQFSDDDGVLQFVLSNGNTTPAERYNNLWKPAKTAVNWKAKGDNPDKRQQFLKP